MIPPTAQRRWPWYLLVASLAGNMLLIGAFTAHFFHPPPPPPGLSHGMKRLVERASDILPPADAQILRRAFDAERGALALMDDNQDAMRQRLRDAVRATPFDAEALRNALDAARTTDLELRRRVDSKVVEVLSQLSDEGRRRLADLGR
jgi:uncharacterized membrane protein